MNELAQWEEWNLQGFIPGPDETEIAFTERVDFCKNLQQNLMQKVGENFPFDLKDHSSDSLGDVLPFTKELFGIAPQWVPLFFNNYHLAPWHGGCAWIFQMDEKSPTAAFLQLRSPFRFSSNYLGLYNRKELIAHELAHVGRMLYQEPQFEELFAYQTSTSKWRCWLGPIVQSSKESLFFILSLGIVIMADLASLGSGMNLNTWWLKMVPFLLVVFGIGRLFYRHSLMNRCLANLESLNLLKDAKHLLYRLRDSEIKQFARLPPSQIQKFIDGSAINSFRWRFLKKIYFPS